MLRDSTHYVTKRSLNSNVCTPRHALLSKNVERDLLRQLVTADRLGFGGPAHQRQEREDVRGEAHHERLEHLGHHPSGHALTRRWCGRRRSAIALLRVIGQVCEQHEARVLAEGRPRDIDVDWVAVISNA